MKRISSYTTTALHLSVDPVAVQTCPFTLSLLITRINSLKMVNYQSVSCRSVLLLFLSTVVVFVFLFQSLANNSFLAEEVKVNANYCAYKCHNGLCLSEIGLVCDQRDDCGDNSDEFHCGKG